MRETCKSCGTVFDLDENTLSNEVHWLKCSVCNEKWIPSTKNINTTIENKITTIDYKEKLKEAPSRSFNNNEINKVKNELASIKFAVENNSKQMSDSKNSILNLKNQSVAEIANELAASKLKNDPLQESKRKEKNNVTKTKKIKIYPLILVTLFFSLGVSVFFRSAMLGYSYKYLPSYTKKYNQKINEFFQFIKLPIMAELNYIKIEDFSATFQKNTVKFIGILKNNSSRPILVPKIKVIAVTEDGKILIEKIIPLIAKVLLPFSQIEFNDVIKTKFKQENIRVRATLLKEVF